MTAAELFLGKPTAARAAEPERTDILLVDEEPNVRASLKRMFKEESCRVLTTGNATEAPDILSRQEMLRVPGPRAGFHRLCPKCAAALDPGFTVCPHCGHEVRHLCRKCATRLADAWKCCPTCGRPRDSELEP